jgi:integrase
MASITKVGDRKWRARYRTPDGASRSRTFAKRAEAEAFLVSVEHAKDTGVFVDRSMGRETLASYAETWLSTRRLRPRTEALYRSLLNLHILPELGRVELRKITPEVVQRWHARLPGRTVPAKSYRLLRAIMATAADNGRVGRNPCRLKGAGIERSPERPLPTGDDVWALADAIDDRYRALVLTAAFVGLRWGELLGLRRSDVDLETRTVHVLRQIIEVDGRIEEGPPKSEAGVRAVAMPPAVAVELASHMERFVGSSPDARVFVGAKGATPRRANFSPIWSSARAAVGRPDLHLHDLRHYANLMAASAGASTKELMSRLGHASPAAALRYQHATAERDQLIAARMEALIGGRQQPVTAPLRVLRRT